MEDEEFTGLAPNPLLFQGVPIIASDFKSEHWVFVPTFTTIEIVSRMMTAIFDWLKRREPAEDEKAIHRAIKHHQP